MKKNVLLVGSGAISIEYVKVLRALCVDFTIVGRGEQSAKNCSEATGCRVVTGGLAAYLSTNPDIPSHAIVAVGIDQLYDTTLQLLAYGVQTILVEKPAGLSGNEVACANRKAKEFNAQIYVAYNRRFYSSVLKAGEIIAQDGGVQSFNFEFTEWSHQIENLFVPDKVKRHWFLANSTHVADTAFHLGGTPKSISTFTSGSLSWHPSASTFAGAGVSDCGALFSYQANWKSAGRWGIEILTEKNRLILRPMEKLHIQKKGSVSIESFECDDKLDRDFKPGLFLQTQKFINDLTMGMCKISDQDRMMKFYNKIAAYC